MAVEVGNWWFYDKGVRSFLRTAAPGSFEQPNFHGCSGDKKTLLLSLGEQLLERQVSEAPETEWGAWLFCSLQMVATADNIHVFRKIFALYENDDEFWAGTVDDLEYHYVENKMDLLLIYTAEGGSAEILSALLEYDRFLSAARQVNVSVHLPASLLICAARNGHRGCVAILVEAGAPVNYKWYMGETALTTAVENGHEGVVLELLAAGADVESFNNDGCMSSDCIPFPGFTSLGIAVAQDNESMVDIFLAAGASFGHERTDNLHVITAARTGSCGSLQRLIEAGVDTNEVDSRGQSALHVACTHCRDGVVDLLLRHNASLASRCDDEGLLPYDMVAQGLLGTRENWRVHPWRRGNPATLDAVETAAADRIYSMLHEASAWGRRGWLIMMRARRLAAVQLLDGSSLEEPSPAEQDPPGNDGETKEREGGGVCVAVGRLTLAGASSTAARGEFDELERNSVSREGLLSGEGRENGNQVEDGGGWECAVEWLLSCPDERCVFREILGFL